MGASNPKVVVIGWHGANWKTIHPLVDAGLMPNLRSMMERGVAGNMRARGPGIPAILWTSIATGKTADQHGILSSLECDPISGGVRPVRASSRVVKTVWNIAMQSGLAAHVAGWCATYPAEPLNGSCVSSEFVVPTAPPGKPWPVQVDSMYPPRLEAALSACRFHAGELSGNELLPFIPDLAEIDQRKDDRVLALADILAREISMHAVVTWLLEHEPWNLMVVGWQALGRACHRFMQYAPPQMPQVSAEDCARYGEVVNAMYRFEDMLLGRLMDLAGPEATFLIVSAAGFRGGSERPISAALQSSPSAWYRPQGIFCVAGPDTVQDELVHGVTLLDIAPTILAILGLAAGADMPGRVIEQAFRQAPKQDRVPSWEAIPGECGMRGTESAEEQQAAAAGLAELLGEGYSEPQASTEAMSLVNRERLFNTVLAHLGAGRLGEARPALLKLASEAPLDIRLRLWLAHCHILCGDRQACRDALHEIPREGSSGAMACLIESHLAIREGDSAKALAGIRQAESLAPNVPIVSYSAGLVSMGLQLWDEAEKRFRQAMDTDPAFQAPRAMLSRLLSENGRSEEAAEAALGSLEIDYASPFSHLALGLAMVGAHDGDRAIRAFDSSLAFDPGMQEARAWAAALRAEQQSRAAGVRPGRPN